MVKQPWFTVQQIDNATYAISEYQHWEHTHCYLLIGERQALLIDTGLGVMPICDVVRSLTDLPVIAAATHVHWDHIGGHASFDSIAVHSLERGWLQDAFPLPLEIVKAALLREPCEFPQEFSIENYYIYQGEPQIIMNDGDVIDLGGRKIDVYHTPGHSPGHLCFYESKTGYLFSGDLIYQGTLYASYPSTDPVAFFHSVRRMQELPVKYIFPGHHSLDISTDIIDRISDAFRELYEHDRLHHGNGVFDYDDFRICI